LVRERLWSADSADREEGCCEQRRTDTRACRGGGHGHQRAADCGPEGLRRRPAAFEQAGGPHQCFAIDESYETGLVGDVEEHRQATDRERDHEQRWHAECAEKADRGDHAQRKRPAGIRRHHHRAGAPPVHPRAGRQREQQQRGLAYGTQNAQPTGVHVEGENRDQRHDHRTRLLGELGEALADPEPSEVGITPQAR
jgi:hypothetical protein